jgi:two-component system, NtrC family, nitrogen regulation response regulator GlnG
MASGREIFPNDLPPELRQRHPLSAPSESVTSTHSITHNTTSEQAAITNMSWEQLLGLWARQRLKNGEQQILDIASPAFERAMIDAALEHSHGKKRLAAELLGWGRNTLTRKLRELGINAGDDEDEA